MIGTSIFIQFYETLRWYQCRILFKFCKSTKDSAIEGGGECNTPVLTPLALKIHDMYIVNNVGVEPKAKAPPSIWLCCVSVLRMVADGYRDIRHIFNCGIM